MAAILADDIFKCIFLNENDRLRIHISLKFIPRNPIDNNPWGMGLDNGLAPNRRQAIIWTNADPNHWRIYAALGGDERPKKLAGFGDYFAGWSKGWDYHSYRLLHKCLNKWGVGDRTISPLSWITSYLCHKNLWCYWQYWEVTVNTTWDGHLFIVALACTVNGKPQW